MTADAPGRNRGVRRPGVMATLGQRVLGHSTIFSVGTGLGMALAIGRVAILTRLLEISIYGQLTLLVFFAGLLTMLTRMLIVTGTLMSAFKGADDEVGIEDEAGEPDSREDQRKLLGTGLIGSVALTVLLVASVGALADQVDLILIGSGGASIGVVLAAALGGLDGSFRLASHIPRFERKPVVFVLLQLLHTFLGLALATVWIELGHGLNGAIGGLAVGSALSLVVAIWVSRHRFDLRPHWANVPLLTRTGAPFIAISGGLWLFRYVDLFMISRYLPEADIALYRVAARVGAVGSSVVSGVLLAWGPLMRGPLRGALHREGLLETAGARLLTYFSLLAVWLVVILVVFRDFLIMVAAPEYAEASYLIPLLGLGTMLFTGMIMIHRTSQLKRKRRLLIALSVAMPITMITGTALLVPRFGLDGAVASAITVPFLAAAIDLLISQTRASRLDLPFIRLLLGAVLGGLWITAWAPLADGTAATDLLAALAASLLFPAVLVAARILPRGEAENLLAIIRRTLPGLGEASEPLLTLAPDDLKLLGSLLREGRPAAEIAAAGDQTDDEVFQQMVLLLREAGDIGEPTTLDAEIGRYLQSEKNVNLRDRDGLLLTVRGNVSPLEIDELTRLADRIGAMSERQWRALVGEEE